MRRQPPNIDNKMYNMLIAKLWCSGARYACIQWHHCYRNWQRDFADITYSAENIFKYGTGPMKHHLLKLHIWMKQPYRLCYKNRISCCQQCHFRYSVNMLENLQQKWRWVECHQWGFTWILLRTNIQVAGLPDRYFSEKMWTFGNKKIIKESSNETFNRTADRIHTWK